MTYAVQVAPTLYTTAHYLFNAIDYRIFFFIISAQKISPCALFSVIFFFYIYVFKILGAYWHIIDFTQSHIRQPNNIFFFLFSAFCWKIKCFLPKNEKCVSKLIYERHVRKYVRFTQKQFNLVAYIYVYIRIFVW